MQYYVSKNHNRLNGRQFSPEMMHNRICLNPKYAASVSPAAKDTMVLLDSGAFQDRNSEARLSFSGALTRQLEFEDKQGFRSELIVSYDRLVDEEEGASGRNKHRVSSQVANAYVEETINAAKFLADQRDDLAPRQLVLSCQGISLDQYVECVKEVLSFATADDAIGLGGFCIIGQKKRLCSQYYAILEQVLPLIKEHGINRLHLFGVGYFPPLVRTHAMCRQYGIQPSYDTSSYEFNGVIGRVFNPLAPGVSQVFRKDDKHYLYHPAEIAKMNIRLVANFWAELDRLPILDEPGAGTKGAA